VSIPLSTADVERIASLAHLELTTAEKTLFTRQLADVLAYAEQVQQIDTAGVPATAQVHGAGGHERADVPVASFSTDEMLANAPDTAPGSGLFRVPRVMGG
jgi:aspartyl-tRNA(Asn)/glutamyl-tRNA(Gln) amidotransferase subunit C